MELELVLLTYVAASPQQVSEFVAAAGCGSVAEDGIQKATVLFRVWGLGFRV